MAVCCALWKDVALLASEGGRAQHAAHCPCAEGSLLDLGITGPSVHRAEGEKLS